MNSVETIVEEPEEVFDTVQESLMSIYDDASNCFDSNQDSYSPLMELIDNIDSSILIDDLSEGPNSARQSLKIEDIAGLLSDKTNCDGIPLGDVIKEGQLNFTNCWRKLCGETARSQSQEPWPKDVKLYQPYEVEQILLPDNANCLAVQTFLKMCNLDYKVEPRANAEAMSPTGKVPFIRCGAFIVSELEGIVQFVGTKGITLTSELSSENKSDMRAYMTLVNNVLGNAELYICWCDSETYSDVTKPRYGSIYPFPLNHIQTWTKRSEEIKRLKVLGWYQKSIEEVYSDVETCCQALTDRLDGNEFFFGSKFTELDALVYGHLFILLTAPVPAHLGQIVKHFKKLVDFVGYVDRQVYDRCTHLVPREFVKVARKSLFYVRVYRPTELEALIFGHLYTILTTPLPNAALANTVKNFPELINLITRIEKQYFQRETQH